MGACPAFMKRVPTAENSQPPICSMTSYSSIKASSACVPLYLFAPPALLSRLSSSVEQSGYLTHTPLEPGHGIPFFCKGSERIFSFAGFTLCCNYSTQCSIKSSYRQYSHRQYIDGCGCVPIKLSLQQAAGTLGLGAIVCQPLL